MIRKAPEYDSPTRVARLIIADTLRTAGTKDILRSSLDAMRSETGTEIAVAMMSRYVSPVPDGRLINKIVNVSAGQLRDALITTLETSVKRL